MKYNVHFLKFTVTGDFLKYVYYIHYTQINSYRIPVSSENDIIILWYFVLG